MVIDAIRAYLQVPETRKILVRPPKDWDSQQDYVPQGWWLALTKWYGERDAAQEWQEFLAEHCKELKAVRGIRDPTKFYFPDKHLYVESHVDDMHVTGPDDNMMWFYEQLLARGGEAEAGHRQQDRGQLRLPQEDLHHRAGGHLHGTLRALCQGDCEGPRHGL